MARIPNLAETNGVTPLLRRAQLHLGGENRNTRSPRPRRNRRRRIWMLMRALLDRGANPNARLKMKVWYVRLQP